MKISTTFVIRDHLQAAPFVDLVNIKVIGGKGGNGSVAFSKKPRSKALLGKI